LPGDGPAIVDAARGVVTSADFTTTVTGGGLLYDLEVHIAADLATERLELASVTLRRRPGGPRLDSTALRKVPLGAITRTAIRAASIPCEVVHDEDGRIVGYRFGSSTTHEVPEALVSELSPPRRRTPAPDLAPDLAVAAQAYSDAAANGQPRYAAVQRALHCSRATAARRIAAARAAGLIPEEGDE